jgi:hypothetical protein
MTKPAAKDKGMEGEEFADEQVETPFERRGIIS